MGQKKGQTGNPLGRPKGSQNKTTIHTKQWVQNLIDNNRKQLEKDLLGLKPSERWQIIEKLLGYCIPKQTANDDKLKFDLLTDSQLNTLIKEIEKSISNEN